MSPPSRCGQVDPAVPVVLGQPVLDAPDREPVDELGVVVDHLGGAQRLAGDVVGAVAVELAGRRVQRDGDPVAARGVARVADGRRPGWPARPRGGRCRARNRPRRPARWRSRRADRRAFNAAYTSAPARTASRDSWRPERREHELLEVQAVRGVGAAVDHVEVRHRQSRGHPCRSEVPPQRNLVAAANARAAAMDTPTMALAPRPDLFSVPSSSISSRSSSARSANSGRPAPRRWDR